jgi:hypothetical protein
MPAREFVPLGPLIKELTRFPGGKFYGVFFDLEDAIKEALGSGDVPMHGRPVRVMDGTKADADVPHPRRRPDTGRGLPRRIPLMLGTRIEFDRLRGWTVHVPIGRRSGVPTWPTWIRGPGIPRIEDPGHEIFETFEDIDVDRAALDDALTRLAQAQGRELPQWPTERKRRKPGRPANPWKPELHGIWEARRDSGRGESKQRAEARALLKELKVRKPKSKEDGPALSTVIGWIAAGWTDCGGI